MFKNKQLQMWKLKPVKKNHAGDDNHPVNYAARGTPGMTSCEPVINVGLGAFQNEILIYCSHYFTD